MKTNPILTGDERLTVLSTLLDWHMVDGRDAIRRRIRFDSFQAAIAFMSRAVPVIEAMNHHPEWSNVYDRIDVVLTTHDNGRGESGLTRLDIELAAALDALL